MKSSDNTTAHTADEYELEVKRTIPFHGVLLGTAVEAVLTVHASPRRWLDSGSGPGALAELAIARSPATEIFLADPSSAMIALARKRLPNLPNDRFLLATSQELPTLAPFDVITAVQCHHYGDMAERERAVRRCHELLAPGGALVVFENVRAETEEGHEWQRARWSEWMRAQGRDDAMLAKLLGREGTAMFPVRVSEHLEMFRRVGFRVIETIWRAYGQAGFLAVA